MEIVTRKTAMLENGSEISITSFDDGKCMMVIHREVCMSSFTAHFSKEDMIKITGAFVDFCGEDQP
jgi:hypothetical protein